MRATTDAGSRMPLPERLRESLLLKGNHCYESRPHMAPRHPTQHGKRRLHSDELGAGPALRRRALPPRGLCTRAGHPRARPRHPSSTGAGTERQARVAEPLMGVCVCVCAALPHVAQVRWGLGGLARREKRRVEESSRIDSERTRECGSMSCRYTTFERAARIYEEA